MLWVRCSLIKGAGDNLKDYRPAAFWSRRTIQVEAAFATNRFSSSVIAHSTYPIVWPRRTTIPCASKPHSSVEHWHNSLLT